MMRKLIILMLVFGISSIASATLQISVNGIMEPEETEITLFPSEIAILDIWTDSLIDKDDAMTWIYGYALTAKVADASISGGTPVEPPYLSDGGYVIYDDAVNVGGFPLPPGENGIWGAVTPIANDAPPGAKMFDLIEFHCEWAVNDVVVTLWSTWDFMTAQIEDQVIIHQVPEPATIALLGFGSLFLMRRRRK